MTVHTSNPLLIAKAELEVLLQQRAIIEQRIAAVQHAIQILEPLYGDKPSAVWDHIDAITGVDSGLTQRIREIVRAHAPNYLSPVDVRQALLQTGFNAEGRSNFLSEIHNTLKRLAIREEVDEQASPEGKRYRSLGVAERRQRQRKKVQKKM